MFIPGLIPDPETAPVPAVNVERNRQIVHNITHISFIGLQEKGFDVL